MAQLSDLLVSYKQVDKPVVTSSRISQELPSARYQNMLNYMDRKSNTPAPSTNTETTTTDEFKWEYNPESSKSTSTLSGSSTDKSHLYSDKNKWRSDMEAAYKAHGLNDNAIKNLIAKNALESGWGKSAQGRYNYGNITTGRSWKGDFVNGKDHDADGNQITNRFRSYNSMNDYVADEIDFLTRLYDFNQNDDFETFANKLQGGNKAGRKYAGSRTYVQSMRNVYRGL